MKNRHSIRKGLITGMLLAMTATGFAQLPYQNPSLSSEQRAKDLCSRLSLEDKVKLMRNDSPAIPSLGIPQFQWWSEALHGIARNGTATVFPQPTAMAASWDDALLYHIFCTVSDEAIAKNNIARRSGEIKLYQGISLWTPNINIFRDPRWGRGMETYGEDPYLTSRMGLAVVDGLQGQPWQSDMKPLKNIPHYYKTLACTKHFAVHSGPEWNRHSFNVEDLPARDLWETYLPAFKTLVTIGNVREVMCAYQRIDGEPCCGNNRYLHQILRGEWGYNGLVTSDCGAITDFFAVGHHHVVDNPRQAVAKAVRTGTDLECGAEYRWLPQSVEQGLINEASIDTSVIRLLKARFEVGDFDNEQLVPWKKKGEEVIATPEHRAMALQMAREAMTLLQNKNNVLPLDKNTKIALIGPNAVDRDVLYGNYHGTPVSSVTIYDGLKAKCKNIHYIGGCSLARSRLDSMRVATLTKDADVVIFAGGISPKLEGEEKDVNEPGFKGGDRTSIELPTVQRQTLQWLKAMGKKVILVNCSGGAVALAPETKSCDAILQAWYPGEAGGEAVADVLFGDYNPSGKLPMTFYGSDKDLPDYEDYKMDGRTYRYFKGNALFPFGYGLSYTTFAFDKPVYKNGKVSVKVTNTGKSEGTEVVQVYVKDPTDNNGPLKTLRGFSRVPLKAGESKTVSIDMPRERFELWDSSSNTMRVRPGKYLVMVGGSSKDKDLQTINVTIK